MDLFSIEKTNVTGNPAILNDSAKMALQGLTVYGRSNQTKTTGAQLFCPVTDNISMLSKLLSKLLSQILI